MSYNILFVASYLESDGLRNYTMPFIDRQMESLKKTGLNVQFFSIKSYESKFNYIKKIYELNRFIFNNHIDVIHAHYSYAAFTCSFSKKKPLVVSLMGEDAYGKVEKDFKTRVINLVNRLIIKMFSRKWEAVIVKSQEMKKFISHHNLHVIPNGVDFKKFYPMDRELALSRLRLDPEKEYILFGGNPDDPRKNYPLAKEVFDLVKKKIPRTSLIFLKGVPHQDIPLYLNASSCLLLTSLREGSPNIVKEAVACNLPVVSVSVGDVPERLDGLEMCAVCGFDSDKLAVEVIKTIESGHRPDNRKMIACLNIDRVARQVKAVYDMVLESTEANAYIQSAKTVRGLK